MEKYNNLPKPPIKDEFQEVLNNEKPVVRRLMKYCYYYGYEVGKTDGLKDFQKRNIEYIVLDVAVIISIILALIFGLQ